MFGEWKFTLWKSKKAQEEEDRQYEQWAFPYGQPQRERLQKLLLEVFPKETPATTLIPFLTCKELFETSAKSHSGDEEIARHLIGSVVKDRRVIRKGEMAVYVALVIADRDAGAELNYPGAEEILRRSEELKRLYAKPKNYV